MSLKLTGDSRKLLELARKLRVTGELQRALVRNTAEAALDLVKEGFANSTDPYGNKWAPLVLRRGTIGRDSGGMLQSLHISEQGRTGFTLAFSKHYAKYFHGGTGLYGPSKSRIVPKNGKALAFGVRGARGSKKRGKTYFMFRSVKGSKPRPVFPTDGSTPPKWKAELEATATDVLRKHFR